MHENILAPIHLNKTEPFSIIKPFDGSFTLHDCSSLKSGDCNCIAETGDNWCLVQEKSRKRITSLFRLPTDGSVHLLYLLKNDKGLAQLKKTVNEFCENFPLRSDTFADWCLRTDLGPACLNDNPHYL
jgi:hypothetical protein